MKNLVQRFDLIGTSFVFENFHVYFDWLENKSISMKFQFHVIILNVAKKSPWNFSLLRSRKKLLWNDFFFVLLQSVMNIWKQLLKANTYTESAIDRKIKRNEHKRQSKFTVCTIFPHVLFVYMLKSEPEHFPHKGRMRETKNKNRKNGKIKGMEIGKKIEVNHEQNKKKSSTHTDQIYIGWE